MIGTALGKSLSGTGAVDNAVLRADGTAGDALQNSGLVVEDTIVSFTGITGTASDDVITATGSAFANGQPVRFTALTGGSGLNTTTNYFVREVSGATFKVETSIGGGAINFTTNITAGTLLTAHSVQANVTLSENTTETNSALVLTPKGTGAFILGRKPDGTTTGGNARGANAVDLQTIRTLPNVVASGTTSVALGSNLQASATSAIAIGNNSAASGNFSRVFGFSCIASAERGCALGTQAVADRYGMFAYSGFQFGGGTATGTSQRAIFVMGRVTTNNTPTELFLDNSATRLTIPSGKVLGLTINITGINSTGSAVAHYLRQYCLKNVSGTCTEVYAPVTIGTDNAAGTSIALSAYDVGATEALKVEVTGIAAETWRWVASVDAVEIAYGI